MNRQRFFYEVFNARNLTPEQVAHSFVAPDEFSELWTSNHVVLMGPRGSGKTTLFKMLTLPALNSWNDAEASYIRKHMGFTAVYIPTDIHWHHQLEHAKAQLREFPRLLRRLSEVAVTTNVLAALCTSMGYIIRKEYLGDRDRESGVCEVMIREWKLPATVPILPAVMEALTARINDMYLQINRLTTGRCSDDEIRDYPAYFFLDYLAATRVACTAFDRFFQSEPQKKWALCFDELELAPQWLQERLFAELRSTDERFVFKLSTSPIPSQISPSEATPGHDYTVIRLWPNERNDPRAFCDRLVRTILARQGLKIDPDDLFGSSLLGRDQGPKQYEAGSSTWRIMRDWAEHDHGFRTILKRAGIRADDPTTSDVKKRDQILRKAKPLVLLRHAFLKVDKRGKLIRRSRKLPTIYSGKDAIYDISEGNPRLLIGIVNDILSHRQRRSNAKQIPHERQAAVLTNASKQFGTLIRSLPETTTRIDGNFVQLYTLLERIGKYFFKAIVLQPFTLDPAGSFFVDPETPQALHSMLRKAVYHGALVLVDPADDPFHWNVSGKRFRLSYILAPTFKLPLRLYDPVPLSSCLALKSRRRRNDIQQEIQFRGRE